MTPKDTTPSRPISYPRICWPQEDLKHTQVQCRIYNGLCSDLVPQRRHWHKELNGAGPQIANGPRGEFTIARPACGMRLPRLVSGHVHDLRCPCSSYQREISSPIADMPSDHGLYLKATSPGPFLQGVVEIGWHDAGETAYHIYIKEGLERLRLISSGAEEEGRLVAVGEVLHGQYCNDQV